MDSQTEEAPALALPTPKGYDFTLEDIDPAREVSPKSFLRFANFSAFTFNLWLSCYSRAVDKVEILLNAGRKWTKEASAGSRRLG